MNKQHNPPSLRLHRISLALALFPLTHLAIADEAVLTPIVVKAQSEDAPTIGATRVDATTMQSLRPATSDTASMLRDVPGVSFYGAGGVSSLPVIRGLANDRLRIKVDGMDLIASCPNHMNPPCPTSIRAMSAP